MDDDFIKALAKAAGLERALAEFPADILTAGKAATANLHHIQIPTDAAIEPWPPMKTGAGR
jgi:hypothetical protein